jgi:hypothetical protein
MVSVRLRGTTVLRTSWWFSASLVILLLSITTAASTAAIDGVRNEQTPSSSRPEHQRTESTTPLSSSSSPLHRMHPPLSLKNRGVLPARSETSATTTDGTPSRNSKRPPSRSSSSSAVTTQNGEETAPHGGGTIGRVLEQEERHVELSWPRCSPRGQPQSSCDACCGTLLPQQQLRGEKDLLLGGGGDRRQRFGCCEVMEDWFDESEEDKDDDTNHTADECLSFLYGPTMSNHTDSYQRWRRATRRWEDRWQRSAYGQREARWFSPLSCPNDRLWQKKEDDETALRDRHADDSATNHHPHQAVTSQKMFWFSIQFILLTSTKSTATLTEHDVQQQLRVVNHIFAETPFWFFGASDFLDDDTRNGTNVGQINGTKKSFSSSPSSSTAAPQTTTTTTTTTTTGTTKPTTVRIVRDDHLAASCKTDDCYTHPETCAFYQETLPRFVEDPTRHIYVLVCDNIAYSGESQFPWTPHSILTLTTSSQSSSASSLGEGERTHAAQEFYDRFTRLQERSPLQYIQLQYASVFGKAPMSSSVRRAGHTLAHELGHYFGLLHIFEGYAMFQSAGATTGNVVSCEEAATTQRWVGDDVSDTAVRSFPEVIQRGNCGSGRCQSANPVNQTLNTTEENWLSSLRDPEDLFGDRNVMNYLPDECLLRFSCEQRRRMQRMAVRFRPLLLQHSRVAAAETGDDGSAEVDSGGEEEGGDQRGTGVASCDWSRRYVDCPECELQYGASPAPTQPAGGEALSFNWSSLLDFYHCHCTNNHNNNDTYPRQGNGAQLPPLPRRSNRCSFLRVPAPPPLSTAAADPWAWMVGIGLLFVYLIVQWCVVVVGAREGAAGRSSSSWWWWWCCCCSASHRRRRRYARVVVDENEIEGREL